MFLMQVPLSCKTCIMILYVNHCCGTLILRPIQDPQSMERKSFHPYIFIIIYYNCLYSYLLLLDNKFLQVANVYSIYVFSILNSIFGIKFYSIKLLTICIHNCIQNCIRKHALVKNLHFYEN
jgi:hypothetical protein